MNRVIVSMKAFAQLTALVPASRIFSDEAPEKAPAPYITVSQEGENPGVNLCGNNGSDRAMFDIMLACKGSALRKDILTALRAWTNQADTPTLKVLEVGRRTGFDNLRKLDTGLVEIHVWLKN